MTASGLAAGTQITINVGSGGETSCQADSNSLACHNPEGGVDVVVEVEDVDEVEVDDVDVDDVDVRCMLDDCEVTLVIIFPL